MWKSLKFRRGCLQFFVVYIKVVISATLILRDGRFFNLFIALKMDQIIEVQNVQRRENGQIFLIVLQVKKLGDVREICCLLKCPKYGYKHKITFMLRVVCDSIRI